MRKNAAKLVCLFIALAMMLTGCNLIAIDPVMQLEEDLAALREKYNVVLATYDGGEVTQFDVSYAFNDQYSNMLYLYYYYYGDVNYMTQEDVAYLQEYVTTAMVSQRVAALKAQEEYGITLTEEQYAQIEEAAQLQWEQLVVSYMETYGTGETEEERRLQAEYALYEQGFSYEALYGDGVDAMIVTLLTEAVNAEVPQPTDEEVRAAFDLRVEEAETTYTQNPDMFVTDMEVENPVIYWYPEGFRMVKHILIMPEQQYLDDYAAALSSVQLIQADIEAVLEALGLDADADTTGINDATLVRLNDELATANAAVEQVGAEMIASVQATLDEIYARLAAGEDFDALMAEYGQDNGMQTEPMMTTGYAVSADTTLWYPTFRDGAMMLSAVGDVSEPVASGSGVHIIRYESDVAAGAVAYETVSEALMQEVWAENQTARLDELIAGWVEQSNVEYHLDRWVLYTEE